MSSTLVISQALKFWSTPIAKLNCANILPLIYVSWKNCNIREGTLYFMFILTWNRKTTENVNILSAELYAKSRCSCCHSLTLSTAICRQQPQQGVACGYFRKVIRYTCRMQNNGKSWNTLSYCRLWPPSVLRSFVCLSHFASFISPSYLWNI
jgi:hypothetical protein